MGVVYKAEILKAQRAANPKAEYVFTRNGEPIKDFRKAWRTALEKAGLVAGRKGHTFHGTRRGVATNLMRARVDVKTAMAITTECALFYRALGRSRYQRAARHRRVPFVPLPQSHRTVVSWGFHNLQSVILLSGPCGRSVLPASHAWHAHTTVSLPGVCVGDGMFILCFEHCACGNPDISPG